MASECRVSEVKNARPDSRRKILRPVSSSLARVFRIQVCLADSASNVVATADVLVFLPLLVRA